MTNQLHMVFGAMDAVFRALADATRRRLLDALIRSDGQSLTQLEQGIEMSRHGVMKHLRILESAGLVTCHRHGRRKLHYLNPVPIAALGEAWMGRFAPPMSASTFAWDRAGGKKAPVNGAPSTHSFPIFIRASPERLWTAITDPQCTSKYFFAAKVESSFEVGAPLRYRRSSGELRVDGEVLECDAPHRLVARFDTAHDLVGEIEAPTRVTWKLRAHGDATKLTVTHALLDPFGPFDRDARGFERVASAWSRILSALKTWLETGEMLEIAEPLAD